MTEQEFKEMLKQEFGVESVDELWNKIMNSPEMKYEQTMSFIASLPRVAIEGLIVVAKIMAQRMKN